MNHQKLDQVIMNGDFFLNEAAKAFQEMTDLAGEPVNPQNVERFNKAKAQFWLATARVRKEHAQL